MTTHVVTILAVESPQRASTELGEFLNKSPVRLDSRSVIHHGISLKVVGEHNVVEVAATIREFFRKASYGRPLIGIEPSYA